jgi:hypothetical protein
MDAGKTAMSVNVIWHAQTEGRGRYDSTSMLNDMLDLYDVTHIGGWDSMPDVDGAVIIVHGGREVGRLDRLNEDIKKLSWCIIVALGDEESSFPVEKIEHPHRKIWVQEPIPGRHDFADRFMINGYGHDRHRHIVDVEKDLQWFFGGQVSHERRVACVDALRKINWGGVVIETRGYFQGVSLAEYMRLMCRAKIVLCPSGPFSPDAARPWDALEAGCIPVLDDLSPTRKERGFWKYVLGEHPLPVLTDWNDLLLVVPELLESWEETAAICQHFWQEYQTSFRRWLFKDLTMLGVECTTKL